MAFSFTHLAPMLPELLLTIMALILLVVGVCGGNHKTSLVTYGAILSLIAALLLLLCGTQEGSYLSSMFVVNEFASGVKYLVIVATVLVLIISSDWLAIGENKQFEYPLLMLLSVLGMMLMLSAGNLLMLYMGLELTSLPLYVLAAIQRDSLRSTESGLKYFVLGSLASGMLLFGMSLIYGFSGTIDFASLHRFFSQAAQATADSGIPLSVSAGLLAGVFLVTVGLCFKISAVPFHMWTPDVYEGAPTPVTAFFSAAPKITGLVVVLQFLVGTFGDLISYWQQAIVFISIASMAIGAFGAIFQTNIKRLLAYSSIGHVGYVLVGIAAGTSSGASGVLIYLLLYLFMTVGMFACILLLRRQGEYVENISELSGLSRNHPLLASAIAIFMFSMAGIPPLAGFWGKFYVFLPAIEAGLFGLAIIGMLLSVISAYYYLKIVKIMYFDEAKAVFDRKSARGIRLVASGCVVVTLLFFVYPGPVILFAKQAAQALAL